MYCINNNGLLIAPTLRRSSVYKSCRPKEDIVLSGMLFMPDIYALQMSGDEKLLQLPDSLDWYGALPRQSSIIVLGLEFPPDSHCNFKA
ncbi:hypothetical protein B0F88_107135 [Methylobacter tundripaludum]|uniref:Uncharacterized protein n=1 Tax=Methylobacter tundripaludum TaxID=173365 RepID=A0A2S6H2E7_9GAMM|nr:hypothetical protein B0F88_107135 [Methylobacter tundripaludum]